MRRNGPTWNATSIISTSEASAVLRISRGDVARLCRMGRMTGARLKSGRWEIPAAALAALRRLHYGRRPRWATR